MRESSANFWRCLEDLRGLVAVPAGWRLRLDGEFEAVRDAFLRVRAGDPARSFPCPHECGCAHEVIYHDDGTIVAVCRCDSWNCDDIRLKPEDVVLWELNWSRLGRAVAWALECEPREIRLLVPATTQVGSFGGRAVSVLLTLPQDRDEFQQVVTALVAESRQPFVLVAPTSRFVDRRCRELLEKREAEFLDLASNFTIEADGSLKTRRPAKELLGRFLPQAAKRGSEAKLATFYLFACAAGEAGQAAESVFYKAEGEELAENLCDLFRKEYGDADGQTTFRCVAAAPIPPQDQVLLDERLDGLEVYNDPDRGVYDPEPTEEMMVLAQYGVRARGWEELLRRKMGGSRPGEQTEGDSAVGSVFGGNIQDLPAGDRRNAVLALLMVLGKGYYAMLESVISAATHVPPLDVEVNDSYVFLVTTIQKLLRQRELADFPMRFVPALPDLYPGNIRRADWANRVGPEAEKFLRTVLDFVTANGMRTPEDESPTGYFLRYFQVVVERAIERANEYRKRMQEFWKECVDAASGPRAGSVVPVADHAPVAASSAVVAVPEYLILQEGTRRRAGKHDRTVVSTWRIRFRGHEVLMPPWVGTEYLVFLMRGQGKEFDAGGLTQAIRKHGAAGASASKETVREILHGPEGYGEDGEPVGGRVGDLNERDLIWDDRQIADCLRKIKAFEGEVRLHEKAGDSSSEGYLEIKEKLGEQQELLAANAKKLKRKWVPKEYQKGTFQEKADVIRKHVRKVLDEHLRENCRPLFDHLNDRNTLIYGVKNRYQPKPRVAWVVQLKGDKTGM